MGWPAGGPDIYQVEEQLSELREVKRSLDMAGRDMAVPDSRRAFCCTRIYL